MIFLSEKCAVYKNTYTRITSKVYFECYSFQFFKIISRLSRFNQSICACFVSFEYLHQPDMDYVQLYIVGGVAK